MTAPDYSAGQIIDAIAARYGRQMARAEAITTRTWVHPSEPRTRAAELGHLLAVLADWELCPDCLDVMLAPDGDTCPVCAPPEEAAA